MDFINQMNFVRGKNNFMGFLEGVIGFTDKQTAMYSTAENIKA
jgi:hypothetical protein